MTHSTQLPTVKIAIGNIAVEYTGDQSFIEDGLMSLLESVFDASKSVPAQPVNTRIDTNEVLSTPANIQHMSTNTIASNCSVKSGPDLIMAAVAHLQLVQNREKVHRTDIASEMKGATTYYKTTYLSNLSASLDNLVKSKRLNLVGDKTYALTAAEKQKMESILASA